MLSTEEIRSFIENDLASSKKKYAMVGQRYYDNKCDILDYRLFYVDAEGNIREDKTKSNIRMSHAFFKLLADQEAQYILSGKDGFVKSDNPELQTELDAYFNDNENFRAELYELLVGMVVKGWDYMYAYIGEDGKTSFECADSLGVVEVRDKDTDDHCAYLIRWYVDRVDHNTKEIKRIEVWDAKQTYFYAQVDDGEIVPDDTQEINPKPHSLYRKKGEEAPTLSKDYGKIPFFRIDNGAKQISGLQPIKDQIDSYNLMNCGLSNNIQDTNEALYVVKGFQGDNLDELMQNIKTKKHIGVDEEGDVEIRTIDIPVDARKVKMEIDEKNIFRFGMGVNTEALKDTSATVSIAIKTAYANLDLKCEGVMPYLKRFMRQLLDVVLPEINQANKTDYQQSDVYFNFDREIITNAQEMAQIKLLEAQEQQTRATTWLNMAEKFGPEITMQQLCDVMDLDYDDIKSKLPKPDAEIVTTEQAQGLLDGVVTDGVVGGGVVE